MWNCNINEIQTRHNMIDGIKDKKVKKTVMDKPSQSVFVRATFSAVRILMQSPTSWLMITLLLNSRVQKHWNGKDGYANARIRAGTLMTTIIYHQYKGACAVLSSVAWPALPHFCTVSHKRHNIPKKVFCTQEVCFDFINIFVWNISHSKKK
jgi:hypothetical protein